MFDTRCQKVCCLGLTVLVCLLLGCSDSDGVLENGNTLMPEGLFAYEAADEQGQVIVTGTLALSIVDSPVTPAGEGEFRLIGAWNFDAVEDVDPEQHGVALQIGVGHGLGAQADRQFWFNLRPIETASDIRLVGEVSNGHVVGRWTRTLGLEASGPFVLYPIEEPERSGSARSVLDHPL